jgi:hypothetical protein
MEEGAILGMIRKSFVVISIILVLTSCTTEINNQDKTFENLTVISSSDYNQTFENPSTISDAEEMEYNARLIMNDQFPLVGKLNNNKVQISKVQIRKADDSNKSITIDDKRVIDLFVSMCSITYVYTTEFVPYSAEQYIYDVFLGDDMIEFTVLNDDTIAFSNYTNKYFKLNNVSFIGKAFIERPDYVPKESLLTLMLNSSMMRLNSTNVFYDNYRAYYVVDYLLRKNIVEITKPDIGQKSLDSVTFFYFGQQIDMYFYKNYIEIVNGTNRIWFHLDSYTLEDLYITLSAG